MARKGDVKLGDRVEDQISGFSGICIAITDWLNGCQRITIQPEEMREGKMLPNETIDVDQLSILATAVHAEPTKHSGGPSIAPVRAADPGR